MKYRGEIDGLRAIAVIAVVFFHAGFKSVSGGFVGVDIFFVISGYLITTILLTDLTCNKFSLINFYERRARRILPALFFVIIFCFIGGFFILYPSDMKMFSQSVITTVCFVSNIFFWRKNNYFDKSSEFSPLLHTWSLSIEEQFYIFFPLILFFIWKFRQKVILNFFLLLTASSLILAQFLSAKHASFNFFFLPSRVWELTLGAVVASLLFERSGKIIKPIYTQIFSILGLFLILSAIFMFSDKTPTPSIYTLAPTAGTALIIIFTTKDSIVGKILGSKIFISIGLTSYSAYLIHQPLFAFARNYQQDPTLLINILSIAVFPSAYISLRYIERPFRDRKIFTQHQIFVFSILGSLVVAALGIAGHFTNGFEFRLPEEQRDASLFGQKDLFEGSRVSDGSCASLLNFPDIPEEVCHTNTAQPLVLFAGDSHAMALFSAIFAKKNDLKATLISGHACPMYPNLSYTPTFKYSFDNNCTRISKEVLRVASSTPSIKTVVLVNYYPPIDERISRYSLKNNNLTNREAFRIGTENLLSELSKLNKKVIFVLDVPHLRYESKACFQHLPFASPLECTMTDEELTAERSEYIKEVRQLEKKFQNITVYDPTFIFRSAHQYQMFYQKKCLYNDRHHISIYASELLLQDMIKKLLQ